MVLKKIIFLIIFVQPFLMRAQVTCGGIALARNWNFDGGILPEDYQLKIIKRDHKKNSWQIGIPKKHKINDAYSSTKCIVTNKMRPYPVNDTSAFIFQHIDQGGYSMPHSAEMAGYYKVNSDSLHDYGMIEISLDSGNTWINLITDTVYNQHYFWKTPKPILTGNSNGWQYFQVSIANLGSVFKVKKGGPILFRFSFISDSIPNKLDGLAFDSFQFCDGEERARRMNEK